MHTKLHINISQGIVDVEGDTDLVREIYADFKDKLLNGPEISTQATPHQNPSEESSDAALPQKKPKRRTTPRKTTKSESGESGVIADSPKMDKHLDTAGLSAFYDQFEAKNNPEKILVFLKFLVDECEIVAPNTDQVYSCYEAANERVPKVFSQAFRDASGRKFGYIDYNSPTDLVITIVGNNHFKLDMKKTAE